MTSSCAGARRRRAFALLPVCVWLITAGCSLEYGDARVAESVPDALPSAEITDFSHTVVRGGHRRFNVEAEQVLRYDDDSEQQLVGIFFEELDRDGEVVASGRADFARFFDESEDVEMHGDIEFTSEAEDAVVSASYLYWDRERRMLIGAEDDLVTVEQEDGTILEGYGFRSDMRRREIRFDREIRGRYVEDGN